MNVTWKCGMRRSPSPRPSSAGIGRMFLRLTDCGKSGFAECSSAVREAYECCSLSQRERARVREKGPRRRCPRTRRTLFPFASFRHRERLCYSCSSPSPRPSSAGRGRIVRGLTACPKSEFVQRSKAKFELAGRCSLPRRERVRVRGNSTMSNQRAKLCQPLANESNFPLNLCPKSPLA